MQFKAHKVVSSLPNTLEPNTIYLVRTGSGFDLYCSDTTGSVAHKINQQLSNPEADFFKLKFLSDYNIGGYYTNAMYGANTYNDNTNTNSPVDRIDLYPFFVRRSIGVDRLAMIVRTALQNVFFKFTLYEKNINYTQISPEYIFSADSTGVKEFSCNIILNQEKMYFLGLITNSFHNSSLRGFYPNFMTEIPSSFLIDPYRATNRRFMWYSFNNNLPNSILETNLQATNVITNSFTWNYPYLIYRVSSLL